MAGVSTIRRFAYADARARAWTGGAFEVLARAVQTDPVVIRRIMKEPCSRATYGPPRAWQHRVPKRDLATIALPGVDAALGRAGAFLQISLADVALQKPITSQPAHSG